MTVWLMLVVLVTANANGTAVTQMGPFKSREACEAAAKMIGLYDTHGWAPGIHTVCVPAGEP